MPNLILIDLILKFIYIYTFNCCSRLSCSFFSLFFFNSHSKKKFLIGLVPRVSITFYFFKIFLRSQLFFSSDWWNSVIGKRSYTNKKRENKRKYMNDASDCSVCIFFFIPLEDLLSWNIFRISFQWDFLVKYFCLEFWDNGTCILYMCE